MRGKGKISTKISVFVASTPAHAGHRYCLFSLVHFCSVQIVSREGRGHCQEMWHGGTLHGVWGALVLSWHSMHVSDVLVIKEARREAGKRKRMGFWLRWTSHQPTHQHPLTTAFPWSSGYCVTRSYAISDVDVSHVCWRAGQVHVLIHTLGFWCAGVLLGLPQAGLQQRLDLLLTRP